MERKKIIFLTINTIWAIIIVLITIAVAIIFFMTPTPAAHLLFLSFIISITAAIVGCCGIYQENVCITSTYVVLISFTLILQILNLIIFKSTKDFDKYAKKDLEEIWATEVNKPGAMDKPQITYKCCGKDGPNDYTDLQRASLPDSCYANGKNNTASLYTLGCIVALSDVYFSTAQQVHICTWISILVTLVMLAIAIYLIIHFYKKHRQQRADWKFEDF